MPKKELRRNKKKVHFQPTSSRYLKKAASKFKIDQRQQIRLTCRPRIKCCCRSELPECRTPDVRLRMDGKCLESVWEPKTREINCQNEKESKNLFVRWNCRETAMITRRVINRREFQVPWKRVTDQIILFINCLNAPTKIVALIKYNWS